MRAAGIRLDLAATLLRYGPAVLFLLPLTLAAATPPTAWANAASVRATVVTCGEVRSLRLGSGATPAGPGEGAGCASAETTFQHVYISRKFLPRGNTGPIAETDVDVRHVACPKGVAMLVLGPAADTERALREHRAAAGCTVTKKRYRQVSSTGGIPFVSIPERQTMSVAESLALHARERKQVIAECDASAACRADRARMSRSSGTTIYTCPPGYSLNGTNDNRFATCVPYR